MLNFRFFPEVIDKYNGKYTCKIIINDNNIRKQIFLLTDNMTNNGNQDNRITRNNFKLLMYNAVNVDKNETSRFPRTRGPMRMRCNETISRPAF